MRSCANWSVWGLCWVPAFDELVRAEPEAFRRRRDAAASTLAELREAAARAGDD
jgi:hypothetical protein